MHELALFAGAGGGILGGKLLGWRTVCAVERDAYAAGVLCARQNDGSLEPFPIWSDVCTFDGRPWRGAVDVVSGGFPCQDISLAGKGAGIGGERSGLWSHMARIIGEVRPAFALVENSPALIARGLGRVLCDLAAIRYDSRWTVLGADDVGAPHRRERFWLLAADSDRFDIRQLPGWVSGSGWAEEPAEFADDGGARTVADSDRDAWNKRRSCHADEGSRRRNADRGLERAHVAHADGNGRPRRWAAGRVGRLSFAGSDAIDGDTGGAWWSSEPDVGRVADGVASRVDRLRAIGNGQVPLCAATAWRMLTGA